MKNNGPIPGENLTSDTRKYPWHRPPQIVNINEAVEDVAKRIFKKGPSNNLLTMMEAGVDVSTLTSMIITNGVGTGKWTVDTGLLIAGPIARMLEIMAKGASVKYRMGIEEDEEFMTPAFLKNQLLNKKTHGNIPSAEDALEEVTPVKEEASGGSDAPAPKEGFSSKGGLVDGI